MPTNGEPRHVTLTYDRIATLNAKAMLTSCERHELAQLEDRIALYRALHDLSRPKVASLTLDEVTRVMAYPSAS